LGVRHRSHSLFPSIQWVLQVILSMCVLQIWRCLLVLMTPRQPSSKPAGLSPFLGMMRVVVILRQSDQPTRWPLDHPCFLPSGRHLFLRLNCSHWTTDSSTFPTPPLACHHALLAFGSNPKLWIIPSWSPFYFDQSLLAMPRSRRLHPPCSRLCWFH